MGGSYQCLVASLPDEGLLSLQVQAILDCLASDGGLPIIRPRQRRRRACVGNSRIAVPTINAGMESILLSRFDTSYIPYERRSLLNAL